MELGSEDSSNSLANDSGNTGSTAENHKASRKNKKKQKAILDKTYRFSLDRNGDQYEFNWLDLIAENEEAHRPKAITNIGAGLDPYASDDEEQLRALAKKYEEKYGKADDIRKKKKARKIDDYADLGYGYDSNDPFIDNSEFHDEIVPKNVTTAHGGFYINTGPLEFKARESADEDSEMEAIITEGEKAAKKRKYKRDNEDIVPRKKKKMFKRVKKADGTIELVPITGLRAEKIKKPRVKKFGSNPVGRPKMRNPDGSLVHPPKLPKVKKPVLLNTSKDTSSVSSTSITQIKTKLINVKTASGKKQVMKVTTPGGGKKNVIEFSSKPSSSSYSTVQVKKVHNGSPNSVSTSAVPSNIVPGTTLAGGATISPAPPSNAPKQKKGINNPRVSVTTAPKPKTVKEQLNEVRKQQEQQQGSGAPKYDLTKLIENFDNNTKQKQDVSKKKVDSYQGESKKSSADNSKQIQKSDKQASLITTTKKKAVASSVAKSKQSSQGAFDLQQYLNLFNMQGADELSKLQMSHLQSLIAQSQSNPAYQDLLAAYSVSSVASMLSQNILTDAIKYNPVSSTANSVSKSHKLHNSLSIENLSSSSSNTKTASKDKTKNPPSANPPQSSERSSQSPINQSLAPKTIEQHSNEIKRQLQAQEEKRKQEERAKKQLEQLKQEQELQRKREKCQEAEIKKRQEDHKRQMELQRQKDEEALKKQQVEERQKEDVFKKRQEEETNRQLLEVKLKQQEEAKSQKLLLEASKQQELLKKQQEAELLRKEALRKQQAQEEALKKQQEAQRQQQLQVQRQEEAQRLKQAELQRQEAQRKKQLELQRQDAIKKQEALKKQQEAQRQEAQKQEALKKQQEVQRQEALKKQQEAQRQEVIKRQQEAQRLEALKRQQEAQRQQQLELQRKEALKKQQEIQRQRQFELQRQEALKKQQEAQRQKQLELQRQETLKKQQEAQRQQQLELERQEAQRQKQLELQRQEALKKQQEAQRQQQLELELQQRQEALKKQQEAQRQQQLELQRQQQLELQRQEALKKQQEAQRQNQIQLQRQEALKKQQEAQRQLELQTKQQLAVQKGSLQQPQVQQINVSSAISNNPFAGMQPINQASLQKSPNINQSQQQLNFSPSHASQQIVISSPCSNNPKANPQPKGYSLVTNSFNTPQQLPSQIVMTSSSSPIHVQIQTSPQSALKYRTTTQAFYPQQQQQQVSDVITVNQQPVNNSFSLQSASSTNINQLLATATPTSISQATLDQLLSSPTTLQQQNASHSQFLSTSPQQPKLPSVPSTSVFTSFTPSSDTMNQSYGQRAMPNMSALEKTASAQQFSNAGTSGYYTIQK